MGAPAKRRSKGKRHPATANSFDRIAKAIESALMHEPVVTPREALQIVAQACNDEVKRLRKIVR